MIYLTVGSSSVPFNRLVAEVDRLAACGIVREVVAQIGCATHLPEHLKYFRFSVNGEHLDAFRQADYIICHAGCATLDEGLALGKKMVVVPRRARWREAPDDHQFDLARLLAQKNLALCAEDVSDLDRLVRQIDSWSPDSRSNFTRTGVADVVTRYLESLTD